MAKEKFKINCKNCGSDKIQSTLEGDSGYSDYTVIDSGRIAFKCIGCGKYGSTDKYEIPNELSNFNIRCLKCDKVNYWDYWIRSVDYLDNEKTYIECKNCLNRLTGDEID